MAAKTAFSVDGGGLRIAGGNRADCVRPTTRKLHDLSVSFEEYLYYAKLTRAEEDEAAAKESATGAKSGIWQVMFPSKSDKGVRQKAINKEETEKPLANLNSRIEVTDDEWTNASRALRTATWGACFYLITTDILGPFGLPFAFATTGWGPSTVLYTVFGVLAYYSGWMLYKLFLGLDSYQYPLVSYGDVAFRIYGPYMRSLFNFLQSTQLLCNVGVIIVGNGQGLSQVAKFHLCYALCCLIWALLGFLVGQVRTLQKYGWLANSAIWLNVFTIFMTMGVAATSLPNYPAAQNASAGAAISGPGGSLVGPLPDGSYPPIQHSAGLPNPSNFTASVTGLMQAVYAYGGALLFTEFMAEMRRPRDFIKSLTLASGLIYFLYMLFGLFMYAHQGQYSIQPANQGLSPYAWQATGNVLSLVSGLIAAGLYGNIGIKIVYNSILIEWFSFPSLASKPGKIIWIACVPIYWTLAYVIAAAIPNFFGLTSVVAAVCIMQFTYTFPPMLFIGYLVQKNAIREGKGEGFDPRSGRTVRKDEGWRRWIRGFGAKTWCFNAWNIVYCLGAMATAGLGAYSAITALIATFQTARVNAFTCHSPLDG